MIFKKKKPETQKSLFNDWQRNVELNSIHREIMQETKEFLTEANIEKIKSD